MSKSFIICGTFNKRLLLPFLLALSEVIYIIFNSVYPVDSQNLVLLLLSIALAEMSIKLLPLILKIGDKDALGEKEQVDKKQKIKHYAILSALYLLHIGVIVAVSYFDFQKYGTKFDSNGSNLFPDIDLILMGLEMIFLILISFKLLKYKYYNHHIYSTIVFVIFGIISEICLETYFHKDGSFFISKSIRLIGTVVDATYHCFQKYMMEKYYYPYWNIAFVAGVMQFLLSSILFIVVITNPDKENSKFPFIASFYKFFTSNDLGLSIGKIVVVFVIHFIMCPLTILNLYYFSPNIILIIFQFSRITKNIISNIKNSPDKLYCIVFYVIQFFALMVHLEIIELNFLGLNKYTKRNIDLRGIDDVSKERQDSILEQGAIDINKDYKIDTLENNDNSFEMKEKEGESMN